MSRRKSLLLVLLFLIAMPPVLFVTSTLVLVFSLKEFPGGNVFISGQIFEIGPGSGYTLRILRVDRDSDISLSCPVGSPRPAAGKGYFTSGLRSFAAVEIVGCEIEALHGLGVLPPRFIRPD